MEREAKIVPTTRTQNSPITANPTIANKANFHVLIPLLASPSFFLQQKQDFFALDELLQHKNMTAKAY